MAQLTNQEIFDRAWNGLKDENWPPSYGVWRRTRDCHCAVGCVIGNARLDSLRAEVPKRFAGGTDEEVLGVADLAVGYIPDMFSEDSLKLLQALQCAHDRVTGGVPLQCRLRDVANQFGLTVPE